MNERDSEWVLGSLIDKGYNVTGSLDETDVVIYNTCSVRKHAVDRVVSNMRQLASKLKKKRPSVMFGLIGCAAEHHGEELFQRLPDLDFVCGTANLDKISDLIEKAGKKKEYITGNLTAQLPEINTDYRNGKKDAFVSISRGCNNFCSYCIVPYVRGPERSRKPEDIIKEVEGLLAEGFVNIMLLGQNVNSYGRDLSGDMDFARLLGMIDRLDGKKNIKFMTSHPKDASIELFECMRDLEGLSKHLHLPLQSGSDEILKAMNRGYDFKYYQNKVKYFRRIVPSGLITTDIIVGFPGETEEDHLATKRALEEIEFDGSYIFKYSPRPPAASSKTEDDVPMDVKKKRHQKLLRLQKAISKSKKKRKDGKK